MEIIKNARLVFTAPLQMQETTLAELFGTELRPGMAVDASEITCKAMHRAIRKAFAKAGAKVLDGYGDYGQNRSPGYLLAWPNKGRTLQWVTYLADRNRYTIVSPRQILGIYGLQQLFQAPNGGKLTPKPGDYIAGKDIPSRAALEAVKSAFGEAGAPISMADVWRVEHPQFKWDLRWGKELKWRSPGLSALRGRRLTLIDLLGFEEAEKYMNPSSTDPAPASPEQPPKPLLIMHAAKAPDGTRYQVNEYHSVLIRKSRANGAWWLENEDRPGHRPPASVLITTHYEAIKEPDYAPATKLEGQALENVLGVADVILAIARLPGFDPTRTAEFAVACSQVEGRWYMTTNRKGPLNNPFMAHFQTATYVEKAVTWLNENYPGGKKRAA